MSRAGIDVGGTKILGVVVDDDGRILHESRRPSRYDADFLIDDIVAVARDLGPWSSLGVGVPGLVSTSGVLQSAPNLGGLTLVPVGNRLAAEFGHRVSVDNDATCAAVAEWQFGAARGANDVALITLGTGLGGGLIIGGRVQRGSHGFAGEPGHMMVDPNGPRCVCGQNGCWERFASGAGLAWHAEQAIKMGVPSLLAKTGRPIRGIDVGEAVELGDPAAIAAFDRLAYWLAYGLVNLINLLDPEVSVIGGGLVNSAQHYLERTRHYLGQLRYADHARPRIQLRPAQLGEQAGAVGAALIGAMDPETA